MAKATETHSSAKGRTGRGIHKVRSTATNQNGKENIQYSIGLPRELGEKVAGKMFGFSVTEQGILLTPVESDSLFELDEQISGASWL